LIPKSSKHIKAAAYAAWWLTSPNINKRLTMEKEVPSLDDPWRLSTLNAVDEWRAFWETAPEYLEADKTSWQYTVPEINIPGGAQYLDALDEQVANAAAGMVDPEKALNEAAKRWDQITDTFGRDKQKAFWKEELALWKQAYPGWLT